jgi:hypothetical protein
MLLGKTNIFDKMYEVGRFGRNEVYQFVKIKAKKK